MADAALARPSSDVRNAGQEVKKLVEGCDNFIPVIVSHLVSPNEIYVQHASSDAQNSLRRFTLFCCLWSIAVSQDRLTLTYTTFIDVFVGMRLSFSVAILNWVLSHLLHFSVHRFICVCLDVFYTALVVLAYCEHGGVNLMGLKPSP